MAEDHINSPTEYQLMEEEITSSTEKIYILTSSPLPSHIRSVEVKHSGLISDLSSVPCSSRAVNISLILIFVFVTSLTVSIAVYKITEITTSDNKMPSFHVSESNMSEKPHQIVMTTEKENSTPYQEFNMTDSNLLERRHCAHECQVYRDEKFKSDCIFGRCVCRGQNYQFLTCLPSVGDCNISKGFILSANFSIDSVAAPVYSCKTSNENSMHILSLYGNHYARFTVVNVTGESQEPVTLILANYYPISWKILYQGVDIGQVILVSEFNIGSSSVEIAPPDDISEKRTISKPQIRTLQIPVGFGNDVHNSDTVEMLKILSGRFGPVRSFTGADYADVISLHIDL